MHLVYCLSHACILCMKPQAIQAAAAQYVHYVHKREGDVLFRAHEASEHGCYFILDGTVTLREADSFHGGDVTRQNFDSFGDENLFYRDFKTHLYWDDAVVSSETAALLFLPGKAFEQLNAKQAKYYNIRHNHAPLMLPWRVQAFLQRNTGARKARHGSTQEHHQPLNTRANLALTSVVKIKRNVRRKRRAARERVKAVQISRADALHIREQSLVATALCRITFFAQFSHRPAVILHCLHHVRIQHFDEGQPLIVQQLQSQSHTTSAGNDGEGDERKGKIPGSVLQTSNSGGGSYETNRDVFLLLNGKCRVFVTPSYGKKTDNDDEDDDDDGGGGDDDDEEPDHHTHDNKWGKQVNELFAGDVCGEKAALENVQSRSASIVAAMGMEALRIEQAEYITMMEMTKSCLVPQVETIYF